MEIFLQVKFIQKPNHKPFCPAALVQWNANKARNPRVRNHRKIKTFLKGLIYFFYATWNDESSSHSRTYRSSPPDMLLGKVVLRIYSKFTGEHPCRSVISIKLQNFWFSYQFSFLEEFSKCHKKGVFPEILRLKLVQAKYRWWRSVIVRKYEGFSTAVFDLQVNCRDNFIHIYPSLM